MTVVGRCWRCGREIPPGRNCWRCGRSPLLSTLLTCWEANWMGDAKADFFGSEFPATWGGRPEEKLQAAQAAAYAEAILPPPVGR